MTAYFFLGNWLSGYLVEWVDLREALPEVEETASQQAGEL
jgi:hypothetical protein